MQLIDDIAPYVNIIFVIFSDIKYFMIIFTISMIAFSNAYYLIGRNQLSMVNNEPDNVPDYATLLGSFNHVFLSSLGSFETTYYYNNEMSPYLVILFLTLSFFMCIHLLNMLIAIMGDSFQKNNQVAEADIKKSQLTFVVDNWWIDPIEDKQKIVYLVAAFSVQDDDDLEGEER